MLLLLAKGPRSSQRWRKPLTEGAKVVLGRRPRGGWEVRWDEQISREHAELEFKKGQLKVRKLDSAKNEILFRKRKTKECTVALGDEFRIGRTVFRVIDGDSEAPESVGDYLVRKEIAKGWMGTVYGAVDPDTRSRTVVKILDKEWPKDAAFVNWFEHRMEAAAELKQGNIVWIHEAGHDDGRLYVVMELLEGRDLARSIQGKGGLSYARTLEILKSVATALIYMHEQKFVHGNIKPTNLLLRTGGGIKVADPALARSVYEKPGQGLRDETTIECPVDYMAPEQADDFNAADIRSDIYSLGCCWYEMLTGAPPFPFGDPLQKLSFHRLQPFPDPAQKNPHVPGAAVDVLQKMVAKDPAERYQTPQEFLDALHHPSIAGLTVTCESCAAEYHIKEKYFGKRIKCKKCGAAIKVPEVL